MRVLQICNDFGNSKVHHNLFKEIDKLGIEQIVYNPIRSTAEQGKNNIEFENAASTILYSAPLKKIHSYIYSTKRQFLLQDLEKKVDFKTLDLSVATTLFSDGGVAYRLKKKYGIPYMVAIRATDIHVYLKRRPDLILYARRILKEASHIVFISPSLQHKFESNSLVKKYIGSRFSSKYRLMQNGIADFWLDRVNTQKKEVQPQRLIYVGRLIRRKYIDHVIRAIDLLRKKGLPLKFDIVGDGGNQAEVIKQLAEVADYVTYHGLVKDKEKLLQLYRKAHVFAMPSQGETFGLVYVEALSQGLPILYAKNEGIDGYFPFSVGVASPGPDVEDVAKSIERLLSDYTTFELNKINFEDFRWSNIAKNYKELYKISLQ